MGNLKIEGKDIPFESSVKYLGVQLDSRLHWGEHISLKIEKCKKLLHTYKAAARANFGPQPQMAKLLYTGVVRPTMSYAAMIWGHELGTQKIQAKLLTLDRLALISCAQVKPSTPTRALQIIYDLTPLRIFIQEQAMLTVIRNGPVLEPYWRGTGPNKRFNTSHLQYWACLLYTSPSPRDS